MRHVIIEVTAPDLHTFFPPTLDKHDTLYQNVSVVCLICGKLWAQYRYHFLDKTTGQLQTHSHWKSTTAVCPDHPQGGSLLTHSSRWMGNVALEMQVANAELLLRELELVTQQMENT